MDLITTLGIWFATTSLVIGIKLIRDGSDKNKVEIQNCRKQLKRFKNYNSSLNETKRG